MRHIPLCLFVPFVLACGLFGPSEPTIRLEGTVTVADDGSPVVGARVTVTRGFGGTVMGNAVTGTDGRYTLSFATEGEGGCNVDGFSIGLHPAGAMPSGLATLPGFGGRVRCTDELPNPGLSGSTHPTLRACG